MEKADFLTIYKFNISYTTQIWISLTFLWIGYNIVQGPSLMSWVKSWYVHHLYTCMGIMCFTFWKLFLEKGSEILLANHSLKIDLHHVIAVFVLSSQPVRSFGLTIPFTSSQFARVQPSSLFTVVSISNKGLSSQSYGFSSSHVWMWGLDHKES